MSPIQALQLCLAVSIMCATGQHSGGFGSGRISYSAKVLQRRIPTVQVQQCGGFGSGRISLQCDSTGNAVVKNVLFFFK